MRTEQRIIPLRVAIALSARCGEVDAQRYGAHQCRSGRVDTKQFAKAAGTGSRSSFHRPIPADIVSQRSQSTDFLLETERKEETPMRKETVGEKRKKKGKHTTGDEK